MLLWVRASEYFDTDLYIAHDEWQQTWKECRKITEDYKPQVHITRLRNLRESIKYSVKDSDFVKPREDGDGFDADAEIAAGLLVGMFKRRLVGWSAKCTEARKALGVMPEGDEEPAIVPNDGFPARYRYVGDEKYRKVLLGGISLLLIRSGGQPMPALDR